MPKRRLLWHLFPSYAAITLVAVLGIGWTALRLFEQSSLSAARTELRSLAEFLDLQLGPEVPEDRREFEQLCRRLQQASGVRIALLTPAGPG